MATTITAYLTSDDVKASFDESDLIQLLDDRHNPSGVLNAAKLDELIARTNGEIDSALAARHKLPLSVADANADRVKATLRGYALVILNFHMRADREGALRIEDEARYKSAQEWLNALADGKRTIGTSEIVTGAERKTVHSSLEDTDERIFKKNNWP